MTDLWTNPVRSCSADKQDTYLVRLGLYQSERKAGNVLVEMAAVTDSLYWEHPELLRSLCDRLMTQLARFSADQAE